MSKQKPSKKRSVFVLVMLFIIILCIRLGACSDSSSSTAESSSSVDYTKFSKDNEAIYITAVQQIGKKYYNVKFPSSFSDYTLADFDDQDDGKVMCSVNVTVPNQVDKQELWYVFSTDGNNFTSYYLTLGDDLKICDDSVVDTVKKVGLPVSE